MNTNYQARSLSILLFIATAAYGCSDSSKPNVDPDASVPDSSTGDSGSDSSVDPVCGNGTVETGEACDDSNTSSGDGCDSQCRVEECGNDRVDAGEVCDGTPNCAEDCLSILGCGDSTIQEGEQCDDGNTTSWDGCSASCETEKSMQISGASVPGVAPASCDVTGDDVGDTALGTALSDLARGFIGPAIAGQLGMSPYIVVSILGASDPQLVADSQVRIAWLSATAGPNPGEYVVDPASVTGNHPNLAFSGNIAATMANAGPADVSIPYDMSTSLVLKGAKVVNTPITVSADPVPAYSIATDAGNICGTIQVATMATIPNPIGAVLPTPPPSCDLTAVPDDKVSLADLLAGGSTLGTLEVITATQPDIDMDGDGLETFVVVGGTGCQPVVVSCVDGDGTAIPGHDCMKDPRIADGWSAAITFTATNATLVP